MEAKRFIVVGMQRSGTTVTHVCLAGHPDVTMAIDEVYTEPFYTRGLATFTGGKESYHGRKTGYLALFDALARSDKEGGAQVRGIKTALRNHADAVAFTNCLREYLPDVAVVVVSRDDLVAQYGSLVRAEKSGEWHRNEGVKSTFDGRFTLDRAAFVEYANDCLASLAQVRTLAETHRVHEINYERDIVPGTGYEAIFEFLGISVQPPKWLRMSKVAPPPGDFIKNYDELTAVLAGLMPPSAEAERELARAALRERSSSETPGFLLHRAMDRIGKGRVDDALEDVRVAMAADRQPDVWLRGAAYARVESVGSDVSERDALLARLAEGVGEHPAFLLNRARERIALGAAADAVGDAAAVLRGGVDPGSIEARQGFGLLEQALEKLEDLDLAKKLVEEFEGGYRDSVGFWLLSVAVSRACGDREAALTAVHRALELEPDLKRARALEAELSS